MTSSRDAYVKLREEEEDEPLMDVDTGLSRTLKKLGNPLPKGTGRDVMAPWNDPTDEELQEVMDAACRAVTRREALSDAWIADRLAEAAAQARAYRTEERARQK